MSEKPAVIAVEIPIRSKPSVYPEPFAVKVEGREKRVLGELFGLKNFGVNLTTLKPGSMSALKHRHTVQDEFVYILTGNPTLKTEDKELILQPGMCAGFPANGLAHHLVNETQQDVTYIEIGDRLPGDSGSYPDDDLLAIMTNKGWAFTHKDGTPY